MSKEIRQMIIKANSPIQPLNKGKREKVFLNGHEIWLDREKLMLYDKEHSAGDGIYIFSQHLTKDERRQILDYMEYGS